eukprot:433247-Amphidinium_carterae.2
MASQLSSSGWQGFCPPLEKAHTGKDGTEQPHAVRHSVEYGDAHCRSPQWLGVLWRLRTYCALSAVAPEKKRI